MADLEQADLGVRESWWRRRLLAPVIAQMTRGVSSERIAWTIALGLVLGVFPILGSTTLICLFAGWVLRLNQPILFVFKTLVYPLHLALILVFIHLGERLHGVPLIRFSIPQLLEKFQTDPMRFVHDFGLAAWHGVSAWLLIAPFAIFLIKMATLPALKALALSLEKRKAVRP
jgi:uncharacterized protein (DUF2062 family)